VSDKSFMSIYFGTPQLEQLSDDLRADEMSREAPRLTISEREYREMRGEAWRDGSKQFELTGFRDTHAAIRGEATLSDRSLGTFRSAAGGLIYFVLLQNSVVSSALCDVR